jgi:phage tail sheath gpL-like
MPIEFQSFPANWRLPLFWLEVDPSQAGLPVTREPALMVGQMFTATHGTSNAGTATPDVPIAVGTRQHAKALFGEGSMIERMFDKFFANNFAHEVWALPIVEPSAGQAASGVLTVSHAPSDAGTLFLYIAGQQVQVSIAANDTVAAVAASIVTAVNAMATLPVTAALVTTGGAGITLTCKWKGATGNDITVTANYYGSVGGETYPPALTLTFPATGLLTSGTGLPSFSNGIAAMGDLDFKYVALPFTDQTSLIAWETEYGFGDSGRWGWMRQLYGVMFSAYRATFANALVWSATQNSGLISVLGIEPECPSPVWEWSGAYCSKASRALLNDPARPLQTLELEGILPAPMHKRFLKSELNVFTTAGLATQTASVDGPPMILRENTTYQLNKYGMSDDAYELITTMATLTRLFRNMKAAITSKYPRHKLADDGTRFGVGQAIVTPKIIKAELIAEYRIDEFNGLVENATAFKANLVVERDPNDPNRVNVLYPPDLVNQLRVFAVLAQFRLQYSRGVDSGIGALA